jgi:hypothetical protein
MAAPMKFPWIIICFYCTTVPPVSECKERTSRFENKKPLAGVPGGLLRTRDYRDFFGRNMMVSELRHAASMSCFCLFQLRFKRSFSSESDPLTSLDKLCSSSAKYALTLSILDSIVETLDPDILTSYARVDNLATD